MDESNLLTTPVLRVLDAGRAVGLTLPGVLARLSTADELVLAGLRPHQGPAVYMFLTQLGALALARGGQDAPPPDEDAWRALLLGLAPSPAWDLVGADLTQPAFLQPPVPGGSLEAFDERRAADELDVLVTAKNHEIKQARVDDGADDQWVWTLLTLQTMEGYSGRGNYGIVRMNGGLGSRPLVAFVPSLGWGERFRHDVALLLPTRDEPSAFGFDPDGVALTWVDPWDEAAPLTVEALDPWFIEVCRRVRLTRGPEGRIRAWTKATTGPRIDAKDRLGNLGDPWAPVKKETGASLTLSKRGFHYQLTSELLFADGTWSLPLAMKPFPGMRFLLLEALARGQGKTEGFHARVVPTPPIRGGGVDDPKGRHELGIRAREQVEKAGLTRTRALRPALLTLLSAGDDKPRSDDRPDAWLDAFEVEVDRAFFDHLWEHAEATREASGAAWVARLHTLARAQLEAAIAAAPLPDARRHKAIAAAEGLFEGSFRKNVGSPTLAEDTRVEP